MTGALRIFKREYRGYLASVWIYGVLAAFLVLTGLTFFITADGTREATLRLWFPNLTFVLLVTLPVISSRTLAEERRNRHLDVLLAQPVDTFGVIVGKWLAIAALFCTFLIGTLVYVGFLAAWGNPDWPPLVAAYVGVVAKAKVTLVEGGLMGGDCLNFGCVPSKALIRAAKFVHRARHADTDVLA